MLKLHCVWDKRYRSSTGGRTTLKVEALPGAGVDGEVFFSVIPPGKTEAYDSVYLNREQLTVLRDAISKRLGDDVDTAPVHPDYEGSL